DLKGLSEGPGLDISDALSEKDKVKFTVHTKTTLPFFKQGDFSVVRQHEEFIWLHDAFGENEEYAGIIVSLLNDALHVTFDVDDFFEHEKNFLVDYHMRIKDSTAKADKMTRAHRSMAEDLIRISTCMHSLGTQDTTELSRVASDEDLKLSDLFRYYMRDSQAAKDLLYRRARALVDYENANKALDKARAKNKEVQPAEQQQQVCCTRFEKLSESAKHELIDFKARRVAAFRKNLVEMAELEIKHSKALLQLLRSGLGILKGDH
uniref:Sorting nexin 6 n=1 Tax=Eptatretus burgeri TaxID=7764 RepID=A0A8C4NLX0_EPTBU